MKSIDGDLPSSDHDKGTDEAPDEGQQQQGQHYTRDFSCTENQSISIGIQHVYKEQQVRE